MQSIDDKILIKFRKAGRGALFFTEDFLSFGTAKAVSKALERLVNKGEISRVARGTYVRLVIDPIIGPVGPSTESIAEAIRRRDKARIIPTGATALNALGLSTQVPMNVVYLTDGAARKIDLGNRKIVFKKTAPKNLAAIGAISGLVIQGLKEIGKDNVTWEEIDKILKSLEKEEPYRLEHDIRLAPEWIRIIMGKALKPVQIVDIKLTEQEIDELCQEVQRQWELHVMTRAVFCFGFGSMEEFDSPGYYQNLGFGFHVKLPATNGRNREAIYDGIGTWLNQNYVIRIFGILDSKPVRKIIPKPKIIELIDILRNNIGAHTTGNNQPDKKKLEKATRLINTLFNMKVEASQVQNFDLSIDTVLEPMKNKVIEYLNSLRGDNTNSKHLVEE
jgi:hypothetical protein